MMSTDSRLADRIRKSNTMLFEKATARLPTLREQENWPGFGRVIHGACRDALQLGMLEIRQNGVTEQALRHLNNARDVALQLVSYSDEIPAGQIGAANLDIPIFCCLLVGDLEAARNLSGLVSIERLKFTAGDPFGVHVKMLAAVVLDNHSDYEEARLEFANMKTVYWWQQISAYFGLYESVLNRDGRVFDDNIRAVVEKFMTRAKDRRFGDQLSEYGGLEYNQFAIDFMAVAIAKLASSRGLTIDLDDPVFPRALV